MTAPTRTWKLKKPCDMAVALRLLSHTERQDGIEMQTMLVAQAAAGRPLAHWSGACCVVAHHLADSPACTVIDSSRLYRLNVPSTAPAMHVYIKMSSILDHAAEVAFRLHLCICKLLSTTERTVVCDIERALLLLSLKAAAVGRISGRCRSSDGLQGCHRLDGLDIH